MTAMLLYITVAYVAGGLSVLGLLLLIAWWLTSCADYTMGEE